MYLYLHTGVKRVSTKNVTLTHNYKEKAFSFFFNYKYWKNYVQKKGHSDDRTQETNWVTQWF